MRTNHVGAEVLPAIGSKQILETMEIVGLQASEYIIIGGANLVLRGIKTSTRDIDMLASDTALEKLSSLEDSVEMEPPIAAANRGATNTTIWVRNRQTPAPISATGAMLDGYYPMSFEYMARAGASETVKGISCLTLPELVLAKVAVGRKKDNDDLKAIAQHEGRSFQRLKTEAEGRLAGEYGGVLAIRIQKAAMS